MPSRDPSLWMWAEACELIERADRMHRQFFRPARLAAWEPPVDIFETEHAVLIMVALPGVAPEQVEVLLDRGTIIIAGERRLPLESRASAIRRIEIPHGRFERRIELPAGSYNLVRRELSDGCLVLGLQKLG